ncbi:hypothetical protein ABTN47_14970 [Acinetobacter baumannii]|uniref:hypothetical protein n=1 Tax=Acinetobacter nosocomialis TaxID=106654 RepID=UPI0012505147|nr:hypothetical protein [Acinetobacter nosocomialis]
MKKVLITFILLFSSFTTFAKPLSQATYDQLTVNMMRLIMKYDAAIINGDNVRFYTCLKLSTIDQLQLFSKDNLHLNGAKEMSESLTTISKNENLKLSKVNLSKQEICRL